MKKHVAAIMCCALLAASTACTKKEKPREVEVDHRGIPTSVASIIMGDTCSIDTLYVSEDNVYRMIDNADYTQKIIFDNSGLVAYNPTFTVDTITQSMYRFTDLVSSATVDFADPKSVGDFKNAFPVYTDFDLVTFGESRKRPRQQLFALSVSTPTNKIRNAADIAAFEAAQMDTLNFDGSFRNFANALASSFFKEFNDNPSSAPLSETYSTLAYWMTSRYVTFMEMFTIYTGGAHGMYGYTFPTYLFDENKPLTAEYMFKDDCTDAIRDIIYETLAEDSDFMSNHNFNNVAQVKKLVEANVGEGALPIPAPGLLSSGVVFCYQPYELSSYSDGAFQLVVPYSKLAPYMTEAGKLLIR